MLHLTRVLQFCLLMLSASLLFQPLHATQNLNLPQVLEDGRFSVIEIPTESLHHEWIEGADVGDNARYFVIPKEFKEAESVPHSEEYSTFSMKKLLRDMAQNIFAPAFLIYAEVELEQLFSMDEQLKRVDPLNIADPNAYEPMLLVGLSKDGQVISTTSVAYLPELTEKPFALTSDSPERFQRRDLGDYVDNNEDLLRPLTDAEIENGFEVDFVNLWHCRGCTKKYNMTIKPRCTNCSKLRDIYDPIARIDEALNDDVKPPVIVNPVIKKMYATGHEFYCTNKFGDKEICGAVIQEYQIDGEESTCPNCSQKLFQRDEESGKLIVQPQRIENGQNYFQLRQTVENSKKGTRQFYDSLRNGDLEKLAKRPDVADLTFYMDTIPDKEDSNITNQNFSARTVKSSGNKIRNYIIGTLIALVAIAGTYGIVNVVKHANRPQLIENVQIVQAEWKTTLQIRGDKKSAIKWAKDGEVPKNAIKDSIKLKIKEDTIQVGTGEYEKVWEGPPKGTTEWNCEGKKVQAATNAKCTPIRGKYVKGDEITKPKDIEIKGYNYRVWNRGVLLDTKTNRGEFGTKPTLPNWSRTEYTGAFNIYAEEAIGSPSYSVKINYTNDEGKILKNQTMSLEDIGDVNWIRRDKKSSALITGGSIDFLTNKEFQNALTEAK